MRAKWTVLALLCACSLVLQGQGKGQGRGKGNGNGGNEPPQPTVWLGHSLLKVRPDRPLPAGMVQAGSVQLTAARGECEGVHVVASAANETLSGLSVSATPLQGPGGSGLEATIYREAFVEVTTPSNVEGDVGLWPDALIPVIDQTAGEARHAFPVDVPARAHQPVFVEICVPRTVPAGVYTGEIVLTRSGAEWMRVPTSVDVRSTVIPATSSMPVTFGLSGRSLMFGHYGERGDATRRLELVHRYAKVALRHRISLHAMSIFPPPISKVGGQLVVDFTGWDAEIAPYMNGTALPDGARFTAIDLRTPEDLHPDDRADYYRAVEAHFAEKGWLDRLFAYVMDEPRPEQEAELVARLQALSVARGIRRLVTTSLSPSLEGLVDIWVPNMNCLTIKQFDGEFCSDHVMPEEYAGRLAAGDLLWWYQACGSHGCHRGPFGDPWLDAYFSGWPRYMVDAPGAASRVMAWSAFAHGLGGELYFDMASAFNRWDLASGIPIDPWDDVRMHGGNGDGTLFYPGRPDRIGGSTHVPVESLRLKHIRDGLEDFELLHLLANRDAKGARVARDLARSLAPEIHRFESDPNAYEKARQRLFKELEGGGSNGKGAKGR